MQNIQPDNLTKIKKLERRLIAAISLFIIMIVAGVLFISGLGSNQSALALSGTYSNRKGLGAGDWEKLPADFVDAIGGDTISGKLIINNIASDIKDSNYRLTVKDNAGGPDIYIQGDNNVNPELALGPGGNNPYWAIYSDETSSDDLRFWRGKTGDILGNKMVITNSGNVGIGIDTNDPNAPYAKLQIDGGNLYVTNNSKDPVILVGESLNDYGFLKWDRNSDKLYLGIHNNAGEKYAITIDKSGNVGIGTTNPNPQAKLDVAGYVRGSSGLCIGDDCRTSWPVLQCPPKRVMVDEDSSNSDEWAQYDTCTPASNSIDFTGTRICDGSFESKNCFYLNIDYSYARGCDYFCREFGFQGGEGTTERQKGKLGYADYAEGLGRWQIHRGNYGRKENTGCRCNNKSE